MDKHIVFKLVSFIFIAAGGANIQWISLVLAIIGRFSFAGCFSLIFLYTSELFPTIIRNFSLGACSFWSRVGGVVAPQVLLLVSYFILLYIIYRWYRTFETESSILRYKPGETAWEAGERRHGRRITVVVLAVRNALQILIRESQPHEFLGGNW